MQPSARTFAWLVAPWRLVLLSIAALLAGCTLIVPPWWAPIAGQLIYAGSLPAADAVHRLDLPVSLISQYQGLTTSLRSAFTAGERQVLRNRRPTMLLGHHVVYFVREESHRPGQ